MTGLPVADKPVIKKGTPGRFLRRWGCVLLFAVCMALTWLAQGNPGAVEKWFSRGWYPFVARTYGALISLLPVSLAELCILLLVVLIPALTVRAAVRSVRARREQRFREAGREWLRLGVWIGNGICVVVSVFVLFCGLNYYRPTFAVFSGLEVRDSSSQELYDLCAELLARANALRPGLQTDERGVMKLSEDIHTLSRQAKETFGGMAERFDVLPDFPILPKPVMASRFMSMMQITGVFCPITFEANINAAAPAHTIPATACHELAHSRGFMREDEANFIGYLASIASDSPEFQYSGVMMGLIHAQNQLYSTDKALFREYAAEMSEGVWLDFKANDEYWARYEGPVATVSNVVNDTYLRANSQAEGVHSYGRMVDLLLADYRQRHGVDGGDGDASGKAVY